MRLVRYLEELLVDPPGQRLYADDELIAAVAETVHTVAPALTFSWIPYYKGPSTPWLDKWETLGFDFVTFQPNYAFNNVTAAERFAVIRELAVTNRLGVEIEIPNGVRNAQAGGWQGNFASYVDEVESWCVRSAPPCHFCPRLSPGCVVLRWGGGGELAAVGPTRGWAGGAGGG